MNHKHCKCLIYFRVLYKENPTCNHPIPDVVTVLGILVGDLAGFATHIMGFNVGNPDCVTVQGNLVGDLSGFAVTIVGSNVRCCWYGSARESSRGSGGYRCQYSGIRRS